MVRGGRYDHLLEKLGKNPPLIGFPIIVDDLMSAHNRQKIHVDTNYRNLIVYTEATEEWAVSLAMYFRSKGKNIEIIKREPEDDRKKYEDYAKSSSIMSMLYLLDDYRIEMVNLITGEEKTVTAKKQ